MKQYLEVWITHELIILSSFITKTLQLRNISALLFTHRTLYAPRNYSIMKIPYSIQYQLNLSLTFWKTATWWRQMSTTWNERQRLCTLTFDIHFMLAYMYYPDVIHFESYQKAKLRRAKRKKKKKERTKTTTYSRYKCLCQKKKK